jgi:hypothetical protein
MIEIKVVALYMSVATFKFITNHEKEHFLQNVADCLLRWHLAVYLQHLLMEEQDSVLASNLGYHNNMRCGCDWYDRLFFLRTL